MSIERRAWRSSLTIAAKALAPSGSGTSWSRPLMIGPGTTGGRGRAAPMVGAVRPGAQEAASSARRRRGNRRQRDGPYTVACYYIFVYLSMPRAPTGPVRNWRYNSAASASMKAFLGIVELVLALLVRLGVPLMALLTVLALVFRGVILSPEAPRPGGTYVEGVVGQLGSLNPLFGEATAGSNDLDALLFEPLVRVLPTGAVQGRLASHWE